MVPRGLDQSEQDHSLHLATLPIGAVTLKAPKDELPWWPILLSQDLRLV